MWTKEQVAKLVKETPVVVFGKGTKNQPMCGFTARAIQVLNAAGALFEVVNIFDDPTIEDAVEAHSQWPTYPQVFVGGELLGGSDIVHDMFESGELQPKLEAALPKKSK